MSPEKTKYLLEKYSLLFRLNGHPGGLPYCSIDCGDGWFVLIDELCQSLMMEHNQKERTVVGILERLGEEDKSSWTPWMKGHYNLATLNKARVEFADVTFNLPLVSQIKQKFGTLRFYTHGGDSQSDAKIHFAEQLSGRICEECGSMDARIYSLGWMSALCPVHAEKQYGKASVEAYLKEINNRLC